MSEKTLNTLFPKGTAAIIGVFKFDHKQMGYPQLLEIAQEWAKDKNFIEVILRPVSQCNYGIQFMYTTRDTKDAFKKFNETFYKPYKGKIYAQDVYYSNAPADAILKLFDYKK